MTDYEVLKEKLSMGEVQAVNPQKDDYDSFVAAKIHGKIEHEHKMGRITTVQMEQLVSMIPQYVANSRIRDQRRIEESRNKTAEEKIQSDIVSGRRVPEFVSDPKNLAERRSRANYWRGRTKWHALVETVTLKNKKFSKLWNDFNKAAGDEQRQEEIINEMEKMFPTTDDKIAKENRRLAGK